MADELDTLRSLVRQIAVNHDAEWGRQMAREHMGMGPAPGAPNLVDVLLALRARDDRNGSLPPWYRDQIDAALRVYEPIDPARAAVAKEAIGG